MDRVQSLRLDSKLVEVEWFLKEAMLLFTDQVVKVKEVEYKVHEINDSRILQAVQVRAIGL